MEKAGTKTSIPCLIHHPQLIQKIDPNLNAEKQLYCTDCVLESEDPKSLGEKLKSFNEFLTDASVFYKANSQKLVISSERPAEYAKALSAQNEELTKLKQEIKKTKESVEVTFKKITETVLAKINQTKNHYLQLLDERLAEAFSQINLVDKEIRRTFPKKEDIEYLFPSKKELEKRLSKASNFAELNSFTKSVAQDMDQNNSKGTGLNDLEAKKAYIDELLSDLKMNFPKEPSIDSKKLDFKTLGDSIKEKLEESLKEPFSEIGNIHSVTEARVLMLGYDSAGKTSILYRLKMGEKLRTVPTIGFNVETLQHKNLTLAIWDVGGQEKIRTLWKHYYANTSVLIFVVSSAEPEKFDEIQYDLQKVLSEGELSNVPVLIYANKQDLGVASVIEVTEKLSLNKLTILKHRDWAIQGCSVETGDGINEGLEWIWKVLTKKR